MVCHPGGGSLVSCNSGFSTTDTSLFRRNDSLSCRHLLHFVNSSFGVHSARYGFCCFIIFCVVILSEMSITSYLVMILSLSSNCRTFRDILTPWVTFNSEKDATSTVTVLEFVNSSSPCLRWQLVYFIDSLTLLAFLFNKEILFSPSPNIKSAFRHWKNVAHLFLFRA